MTEYFVDATLGNDGAAGTSELAPWKSYDPKVNGEAFNPGDSIYGKKGELWREKLANGDDGLVGNLITFGAYGEGADPIINATEIVTTWTEYGVNTLTRILEDSVNISQENWRVIIPNAELSTSGTAVRIKIKSGVGTVWVDGMSIGERDGASDDFVDTPTRVTFNGGSSSTSTATEEWSDWIAFDLDSSKDHLIHWYHDYDTNGTARVMKNDALNTLAYYKDDAADLTMETSFTADSTYDALLVPEIEVGYADVWKASHTPDGADDLTITFFDGTKGVAEDAIADLTSENEWYWAANVLYVYSASGDPDTEYTSPGVEAHQRDRCISLAEDYVKYENMILKGGYYGIKASTCNHVTIDSIDASYNGHIGIQLRNVASTAWMIQNCTTNYCGQGTQDDGFLEGYGIAIWDGAHDNTVDTCTSSYNTGDGIKIGMQLASGEAGTGNLLKDCTFNNNAEDGVDIIGESHDTTVQGCTCADNGDSGIILHSTVPMTGTVIEYCNIYDNLGTNTLGAVLLGNTEATTTIRYNFIHGDAHCGISGRAAIDVNVYNNVIYGCGSDGLKTAASTEPIDSDNWTIKNNIISSNSGKQLNIGTGAGNVEDYNCIYPEAVGFIHWEGSDYDTLAAYVAAESQGANSIKDDPLMTDPLNDDFNLQSNSPCIDAGVDVGLERDYAGTSVPQGAAPDQGALEYFEGSNKLRFFLI